MSEDGRLDLRYPIGGLFVVLGLMLAVFGLVTGGDAEMYARATAVNINLWWGVIMFVFGAFMWVLAVRAGRRGSSTETAGGKAAGQS